MLLKGQAGLQLRYYSKKMGSWWGVSSRDGLGWFMFLMISQGQVSQGQEWESGDQLGVKPFK